MDNSSVDFIHNTIYNNCEKLNNKESQKLLNEYNKKIGIYYAKYNEACDSLSNDINILSQKYIKEITRWSIIDKNNCIVDDNEDKNLTKINFSISQQIVDYKKCECGGYMKLVEVNFHFKCQECGEILQFTGIVNDKVVKANGRTIILKNNYKHKAYFNSVYKQIFATESFQFKDTKIIIELQSRLDEFCRNYNIDKKKIKCSWFKRELTIMRKNRWLPHINLLKKQLTGYYPPRLTIREEQLLKMYYSIYQKYYEQMKEPGKSYLRCEYIIFKIIDQMLENNQRKKEILSHIPLPKNETLETLDLKYEQICFSSKNILKYRPTIRSDY